MSERTVRGVAERHWENFAIAQTTLEKIRQICKSGTILEFGSGIGTRRLAETFDVVTFEHDSSWIIYFNEKRITQVLAPLSDGWYYRGIVKGVLEGINPADVTGVLVDGPPHLIGRFGILNHLDYIRPFLNCPIFVDDTNREADMILASRLGEALGRSVRSYDCNDEKRDGLKFSVVEWPGR